MKFNIAESFTTSLTKLTGQEQKQAKTTAFDLQLNPAQPGLKLHRLTDTRDPNFWSIRVNQDIRIIVHKTEASFLLAYVDHHDKAYAWAERRRIEEHPRTGSIQIVEVHERIEQIETRPVQQAMAFDVVSSSDVPSANVPPPPIFGTLDDDQLLNIGTPVDWLEDVRTWTEERFFHMSEHLPAEAAEALLEYAASGLLPEPVAEPVAADPYVHPDTLRRLQTIESGDELRIALDFPWEKWSIFLHPSQREIVQRDFTGPARVTGTAGTGKTIVAVHRAAHAVRADEHARVLLTSFSTPLAHSLKTKLNVLLAGDANAAARVTIASFEDAAIEIFQLLTGRRPALASEDLQKAIAEKAMLECGYVALPVRFVLSEWRQVVDPWSVSDMEEYTHIPRIGRRSPLGSKQREALWPVFQQIRVMLKTRGLMTLPQLYLAVAKSVSARATKPFSHIVVDEAQDLGVPELRMMGALADGPNAHFFAGDLGQRIFQTPFSWAGLGVDVRGRSSSLKINYRMSRQIREVADRLLPSVVRDADGEEDDRTGAQSIFEGPIPVILQFDDVEAEQAHIGEFLKTVNAEGIDPREIGVFVRSPDQLQRARQAVALAGLKSRQLSERYEDTEDCIAIAAMHFAKGLEFKAVVVMACDYDVLPLQSRVDSATNEDELREVFDTERSLLYVACTRARDRLLLSGVRPVSEFFGDIGSLSGAMI